jgi:two-component sensor histidine kinase
METEEPQPVGPLPRQAGEPAEGESIDARWSSQFELAAREASHRCANDLQLIVSLLSLQSRRAKNDEVREVLRQTADRISVLALARSSLRHRQPSLEAALQLVCSALNCHAEPQSVLISLKFATEAGEFSAAQVTSLALCVNELVTNALKHGFEAGQGGHVRIEVDRHPDDQLAITVDDDGLPVQPYSLRNRAGLGLELVQGLLGSIGGSLQLPVEGSKVFEMRIPAREQAAG